MYSTYYSFDRLPETYFHKNPKLPENPRDLIFKFQNIFPLKRRADLQNLSVYRQKLREAYDIPQKLPSSYFDFPPPKKPLPSTYHLLEPNLQTYFPFNSKDSSISFSQMISLMRETYYFKFIPNDYFFIKSKLPQHPPSSINTTLPFTFPIKESTTAISLLQFLSKYYTFTTPLSKEWIDLPPRNPTNDSSNTNTNKPHLPSDFNKVNETAGTTFPITDKKTLRENVIKTGKIYKFDKIPDEWIQISKKPSLPDITSTIKFLKNINLDISIPIIQDESFPYSVRKLREHFSFQRLPAEFITQTTQPEPSLLHFRF